MDEQQARPAHQRPPHRQHLLLPAREGARRLAQPLAQAREGPEDPLQVGLDAGPVAPLPGGEAQVLMHREVAEDPAPLGDVGDAEPDDAVGRDAPEVLALEADAPPEGRQARDRPEHRGLAGPVRADQGDDLARPHREGHAVERADAVVAQGEVADLELCLSGRCEPGLSGRCEGGAHATGASPR